jgi:hypothetical protein
MDWITAGLNALAAGFRLAGQWIGLVNAPDMKAAKAAKVESAVDQANTAKVEKAIESGDVSDLEK